MKRFICSLMLLLVVSCSSAPQQTYRPSGYTGAAWRITGTWSESLLGDDTLIVNINEQEVIKGKFSIFEDSVELSGLYDGHRISASCTRGMGWLGSKVQAIVFVDEERAATLQF